MAIMSARVGSTGMLVSGGDVYVANRDTFVALQDRLFTLLVFCRQ